VNCTFATKTTEFPSFQALSGFLFILPRRIIPAFAISARQRNQFTHNSRSKSKTPLEIYLVTSVK